MPGLCPALFLFFLMAVTIPFYAHPAKSAPVRMENDIVYGHAGGTDLVLDAALPNSKVPTPAVIVVHGGGWVRGDRRIDVRPLFQPLSDAGFAWFSISYRLATDVTQFGVAIDDVETAVRYVKAHAHEFNVDPDRIALVGESAGGQLAAMAALRGGEVASVRAVVAFYTPTDLVSLIKDSTFIPSQIRSQVIGTPWERLVLAGLTQLSPVDNVRRDMPPFLLIHGTSDPLVPFKQSTEMCARMNSAGASCEVYPIEGAGHGIRWWTATERSQATKKMVSWLDREFATPGPTTIPSFY
jgi:alpha-L-fucosidase 2